MPPPNWLLEKQASILGSCHIGNVPVIEGVAILDILQHVGYSYTTKNYSAPNTLRKSR